MLSGTILVGGNGFMSSYLVRETFYRPDQVAACEMSMLPAALHNGLRLLVTRAGGSCVFIPLRAMQYLAVADANEIIFIDAQGGYAYRDGEGGRVIQLAWQPAVSRASLIAPVFCRMVYYFSDLKGVQSRLRAEMGPAVQRMLDRERDEGVATRSARILPFQRPQ
jgi:hypothetical protein